MNRLNVIRDFSELETDGCTYNFVEYAETDLGKIYFCEFNCEYYLVSDQIVNLLEE